MLLSVLGSLPVDRSSLLRLSSCLLLVLLVLTWYSWLQKWPSFSTPPLATLFAMWLYSSFHWELESLFPPFESEAAMQPALINRILQRNVVPVLSLSCSRLAGFHLLCWNPTITMWMTLIWPPGGSSLRPSQTNQPRPQAHEEAWLRSEPGPDQQGLSIDLKTYGQQ